MKKNSNKNSFESSPSDASAYFAVIKAFVNQLTLLVGSNGLIKSIQTIEKASNVMFSDMPKRAAPVYRQAREINSSLSLFTESIQKRVDQVKILNTDKNIKNEEKKIREIIQKISENPPTTSRAKKEARTLVKEITESMDGIMESIQQNKKEDAKEKLLNFKRDCFHKYEPLFRLSQVLQQKKSVMPDECRLSADRIIALLFIDTKSIQIPEELSKLQEIFVSMSKKPGVKRSSSVNANKIPAQPIKNVEPELKTSAKKRSKSQNAVAKKTASIPTYKYYTPAKTRVPSKQTSFIPKPLVKKASKTSTVGKTIVPLAQSISTLPKRKKQPESVKPEIIKEDVSKSGTESVKEEIEEKTKPKRRETYECGNKAQDKAIEVIKNTTVALEKAEVELRQCLILAKVSSLFDECENISEVIKAKNAQNKDVTKNIKKLNSILSNIEELVQSDATLDMKFKETAQSAAELKKILKISSMDKANLIKSANKNMKKEKKNVQEADASEIEDMKDHYLSLKESYDEMKNEMEKEKEITKANREKEAIRAKYLNRMCNNHKKLEIITRKRRRKEFDDAFKQQKLILMKLESIC